MRQKFYGKNYRSLVLVFFVITDKFYFFASEVKIDVTEFCMHVKFKVCVLYLLGTDGADLSDFPC